MSILRKSHTAGNRDREPWPIQDAAGPPDPPWLQRWHQLAQDFQAIRRFTNFNRQPVAPLLPPEQIASQVRTLLSPDGDPILAALAPFIARVVAECLKGGRR